MPIDTAIPIQKLGDFSVLGEKSENNNFSVSVSRFVFKARPFFLAHIQAAPIPTGMAIKKRINAKIFICLRLYLLRQGLGANNRRAL